MSYISHLGMTQCYVLVMIKCHNTLQSISCWTMIGSSEHERSQNKPIGLLSKTTNYII
jgi:hypothetical protein